MTEAVLGGMRRTTWRASLVERPPARVSAATRKAHPRPPLAVLLIAVALAAVATFFSASHGWLTLYNDARTHLDIARRVTDGLTPGLAQLGSVWLPLPQLLMAPFTSIAVLWHSGIAGAIVSGGAFAYSSVRMFSLAEELLNNKLASWCVFAAYATNLNLLYLQSTALDESVMLACVVSGAYHLTRWTRTGSPRDLAMTGAATFLATLTRYEGWGFFIAAALVVLLWTKTNGNKQHRIVQANSLLYAFIGGYGIVLWFLYNLVIFGDPLYFLHSTYSAQAQQIEWAHNGYLPTKGSVAASALTLGWALIDVLGVPLTIAGAAGGVLLLVRRKPTALRNLLVLAALAAPISFDFVSLVLGQTTIRVPQLPPHQIFNLRYALEALPLAALCAGSLGMYLRKPAFVALPAVAGAAALSLVLVTTVPITLAEGQRGVSSYAHNQVVAAAQYLDSHYQGGGILADDFQAGPLIFGSGFNLEEFVTVGFHPYYEHAIADPAANVTWIVTYTGDSIDQDMQTNPARFAEFKLVFQEAPISLYELLPPPKIPPPGL